MRLQVVAAAATLVATAACQTLWSRDTDYKALSKELSSSAKVYFPGSDDFKNASTRWSNLDLPTVNIVVVPGTENDVVETVKFANKKKLPFLAYNSAHGAITTLGKMTKGIEIYLDQLSGVKIAKDGKSVTIGGGTKSKLVTHTLWEAGKQTVTGCCECVGYLGPALGGGHGWLQGRHGLIADQFLSMNIVLSNGTLATIDSKSELWWALKGAGHNFGIVTSVTSKIYDVKHKNWAFEVMTFKGDKVEQLYDTTNKYILKNGTQPTDLINWSYWFNVPAVDPTGPVVQILLMQEGVDAVDSKYTTPFHELKPVTIDTKKGVYTDLAKWVGVTTTDGPCQKTGAMNPRFPIYLETFNPKAQKKAFDFFAEKIRGGSVFNNSLVTFDGYSQEAVKAIESKSTAFAYRDQNILVGPLITYMPGAGAGIDEKAAKIGNKIRQILHQGTGREYVPAYVNYAFGDEGPKQWYGSESWRQDRLQSLKKEYDPRDMFSFYAPIA
ncbi:FAD binding domain-containing protein [Fusarium austroafricanum]|uniref:FAD binding domain-containing protein n=1 Tax=Fusarium austroafricanum TaxID=2364996 RepID=A0A8H4KUL3_9HYPO|nr:FAD binding domain-containing protein [Fusarium austroafricanum]